MEPSRRGAALAVLLLAGWMLACGGSTPSARITRAQMGTAWPLTVEGGDIHCVTERNRPIATFTTDDGVTYALNGAAQGLGRFGDIRRIRKPMILSVSSVVARLDEPERQRIFAEIVRCQDEGRGDQACKDRAAQAEELTATEVNQIAIEGVSRSWPPLDPTYMDLSPIVQRAVALCE